MGKNRQVSQTDGMMGGRARDPPWLFYLYSCVRPQLVEQRASEHRGVVSVSESGLNRREVFPILSCELVIELFSVVLILVFRFLIAAFPPFRRFRCGPFAVRPQPFLLLLGFRGVGMRIQWGAYMCLWSSFRTEDGGMETETSSFFILFHNAFLHLDGALYY